MSTYRRPAIVAQSSHAAARHAERALSSEAVASFNRDGYCVVDLELTSQERAQLVEQGRVLHGMGYCRPGTAEAKNARGDAICFAAAEQIGPELPAIGHCIQLLSCLVHELSRQCDACSYPDAGKHLLVPDHVQFAAYKEGAHYALHRDNFMDGDARINEREWTAICYLNEGIYPRDGGALRIHPHAPDDFRPEDLEPYVDVQPRAGTIVIFRSELLHQVRKKRQQTAASSSLSMPALSPYVPPPARFSR